ncbi:Protein of unknown function [Pseudomonas kuykendallii]|uniref:DUF2946 domain-containing protein n=1 Tax=Pseudomonas kuykendallii TaxID=1007099 RepID=A0A1H3FFU4_9PSED|nr:DUF2946 domain-containing protein [Pseudomonas kuykendallii]SDX89861.1 Protein of unknown function [Pseudomonas kuykendallii]
MHRRGPTRHAAWLGLFAMLLVFAGPLLSQGMAHHAMPGMQASMDMAAMPGMHDMPGMAHADAHPASTGADDALWAQCGYCTLLFSCPALVAAPFDLPPAGLFITPLATPRIVDGHAASAVFPGARSRAPPLFS